MPNNLILDAASGAGVIDFTAIGISDTHAMPTGTSQGNACAVRIPQLLAAANRYQYDYVINTGDALQGGGGFGTFAQQASVYQGVINGLPKPHLNVLGNHDTVFNVDTEVMPLLGMTARYDKTYVGSKYVFLHLYSQAVSGDGQEGNWGLGATQTAWLQAEVAQAATDNKFVVILTHNPVMGIAAPIWYIYQPPADNPVTSGTYNLTMDHHLDAKTFTDLILAYPGRIVACLSGHEHGEDAVLWHGTWFINQGATCGNYWAAETWNTARACFMRYNFFLNGTINFTRLNFWL